MTLRNLYSIRADRRARQTGTAFSSESAAQRQMTKSLGTQAFRSGGLNTSVLAQLMAQNAQANKASFGQDYNQLLSMETDLTKDVTQRASDIDMLRSTRMSALGEQQKAGQDNLLAAIGMGGLKDVG
jgi:asparagine synthetase B (glutamine-hydrolysing)